MKILWIIPCKRGSPLDLLSARKGVDILKQANIEIIQYDFHSSRSIVGFFKDLFKIRNICKANGITYVHAQFGSSTALLGLLVGWPYFVTFRGTDLNGDPDSKFISNIGRKFLGVLTAYFAKGVILVSEPLSRHIIKCEEKTFIIPTGTEIDLFSPMDRSECKKALSLKESKDYISFASGGGRSLKRPDLAKLVTDTLISKGYELELLEIWNTPHDLVPKMLNASRLVILTSDREGSPNIVREALACGIPVLAFDVGDVSKWVKLDKRSSVLKFGDTESMVNLAQQILDNPPLNSRRVDVDLFSVKSSMKRLIQIYQSGELKIES